MPKVVFFWGSQPMSWLRYMTLYSFRKWNPEWEIELYRYNNTIREKYWFCPNKQDFFQYEGRDYFPLVELLDVKIREWKLPNELRGRKVGPSHASNFFKWDILSRESVVYCDMDILFVAPINGWYETVRSADVSMGHDGRWLLIGLMHSRAPNRLFRDTYEAALRVFEHEAYQSAGVVALYSLMGGSVHLVKPWPKLLRERHPNLRFEFFSMDWVYPWHFDQTHQIFREEHKQLPKNCVGIHWFAGGDLAQEANNRLSERTIFQEYNTLGYFASRVLTHFGVMPQ